MELKQLSDLVSNLKKELKDKFKGLSKQEFSIFSALYSLEEQSKEISYKDLAISTGLTESSIRDYISRLIHKGIPIIKEKKISASISGFGLATAAIGLRGTIFTNV